MRISDWSSDVCSSDLWASIALGGGASRMRSMRLPRAPCSLWPRPWFWPCPRPFPRPSRAQALVAASASTRTTMAHRSNRDKGLIMVVGTPESYGLGLYGEQMIHERGRVTGLYFRLVRTPAISYLTRPINFPQPPTHRQP